MLKRFLINMLSSFVGAWIALVLFGVAAVLVGIGIAASFGSGADVPSVKSGSILSIDLSGVIEEVQKPADIDYISLAKGDMERQKTLLELVTALQEASVNSNISAVYLKCGALSAAPATLDALRKALLDFKKSGKPVYAYGDVFTTGTYYVATVADRIYANPQGEIMMQGLSSTNLYMKGLFDKLGVTFQVVKVGKFKSAVEPYISQEMSEPARAQLDTLFGSMWKYIRADMAASRKGVTPEDIDSLISVSNIAFASMRLARESNLVDSLVYERKMDSILASHLGLDVKKLNFVSPTLLVGQTSWGEAYDSKKQIAVLYASGEIVDGGGLQQIDYKEMVPRIVSLADDDNVKGMVLRVNSPGGSAFGSAQIGEALDYFQSKKKKIAVSMGDYAASGGYWISSGADMIYADALTITGSIGIFGLIPNIDGLTQKLGVTPQTVSTNPGAEFPTLFKPMDERQLGVMQKYVERGYDDFVTRVAKGRKMKKEQVLAIAEGRVWNAMKAVQIGLVDSIGSMKNAIDWVAANSGLGDNYDVAIYPRLEPSIWDIIPKLAGTASKVRELGLLKEGADETMLRLARRILSQHPVQARMQPVKLSM